MSRSSRHNPKPPRSHEKAQGTNGYDYPSRGSFSMIAIVLAVGIFLVYSFFTQPEQLSTMLSSVNSQQNVVLKATVAERENDAEDPEILARRDDLLPQSAPVSSSQIEFQKKGPAFVVPVQPVKTDEKMQEQNTMNERTTTPLWIENAVPVAVPAGAKKVVIIIDDLGENRQWTREAITLPAPVTLAYLPYPVNIQSYVEEGRKAGHEIMVHMPMEPMNGYDATSDYMLRADMDDEALTAVLEENLKAFDGYVGINNHMGSRFTQNRQKMGLVMERLQEDGLLFVDSRTIHTSTGEAAAISYGVPYADRDIFLDHNEDRESVDAALASVERIAQKYGQAIAIGHPKKHTIEALRAWLPTLSEKGLTLVPISAAITQPPPPQTQDAAKIITESQSQ